MSARKPSGGGSSRPVDPHVTHLFTIEMDGLTQGRFQEFSGLSVQNEVFEIKEGGLNSYVHKFVTRASAGDLTLKRGFVNDRELFDWFNSAADSSLTERRNGSVIMFGDDGEEICRWNFFRAFPQKWEGPTLNAMSSAIAVEAVTLSCEWVELEA